MKKTVILTILLTTLLVFTSCQSTKTPVSASDSYTDGSTEEANSKKNSKNQDRSEIQKAFSFFNPGDKYIFGDTGTLFVYSSTAPFKQMDAIGTYNIKDRTAGFGSYYLAAFYYVFMDEYNHQQLEKAYNQYLKEFENKKLKRKDKGTFKEYGKISVSLNWGTIQKSTPNRGAGDCFVGYNFYKDSPYFTLSIFPVFNEYSLLSESASRESMQLSYYFTKSQMENILRISSLDELVEIYQETLTPEVESDSY